MEATATSPSSAYSGVNDSAPGELIRVQDVLDREGESSLVPGTGGGRGGHALPGRAAAVADDQRWHEDRRGRNSQVVVRVYEAGHYGPGQPVGQAGKGVAGQGVHEARRLGLGLAEVDGTVAQDVDVPVLLVLLVAFLAVLPVEVLFLEDRAARRRPQR